MRNKISAGIAWRSGDPGNRSNNTEEEKGAEVMFGVIPPSFPSDFFIKRNFPNLVMRASAHHGFLSPGYIFWLWSFVNSLSISYLGLNIGVGGSFICEI